MAGEPLDVPTHEWATKITKDIPIIDHHWQTENGWSILANPWRQKRLQFNMDLQPFPCGVGISK